MMIHRVMILAVVCCFVASCTLRSASPSPGLLHLDVSQEGGGAQFVQFTPHTLAGSYSPIVAGPDGNMWFIDENAHQLVRMSMTGSFKEFNISASMPGNGVSMAVGADKKLYITDELTSITRVTTSGIATTIPIPSGDNTSIDGIALGPDGNVWFTEFAHIGKVTPSGVITEFPYPA